MALRRTDPWYMAPPTDRLDPLMLRYKRALALSEMQHYIEVYERRPETAARHATAIAYRKDCLARWQDYLDGKIDPPTGRKPQK